MWGGKGRTGRRTKSAVRVKPGISGNRQAFRDEKRREQLLLEHRKKLERLGLILYPGCHLGGSVREVRVSLYIKADERHLETYMGLRFPLQNY